MRDSQSLGPGGRLARPTQALPQRGIDRLRTWLKGQLAREPLGIGRLLALVLVLTLALWAIIIWGIAQL